MSVPHPGPRQSLIRNRDPSMTGGQQHLADSRAQIDFDGTYEVFQVGRQVQGTIEAKFP